MSLKITLVLGGRGSGKTREVVRWARERAKSGQKVAVAAPTPEDASALAAQAVQMGAQLRLSGARLVFPDGSVVKLSEPSTLRGANLDAVAIDEGDEATFKAACMVARRGLVPEVLVAATPGKKNRGFLAALVLDHGPLRPGADVRWLPRSTR